MCGFDNLVKGSDLDYHILKEFVPLKRYMYNKLNEVFFSWKIQDSSLKLKSACFKEIAEEDIESELGVVRTQLAYTYQLQGKNDDAQKLYNQVLKSKYVLCL